MPPFPDGLDGGIPFPIPCDPCFGGTVRDFSVVVPRPIGRRLEFVVEITVLQSVFQ
jgi:hypothetical protein